MHRAERGALTRAAVVLLAVSVVRWVSSARDDPAVVPVSDPSVLAAHAAATDSALDEETRRSRPLEDGERIDPNRASEVELDRLPGVGPATAAAIVQARDTMPFAGVDDLLRVRGIGPATLDRIRPSVRLPPASRRRSVGRTGAPAERGTVGRGEAGGGPIDVNRAGPAQLQRLPGIGPALASRIVQTRAERPFRSVDDLLRVPGIGPATLARLRGWAVVGGRR